MRRCKSQHLVAGSQLEMSDYNESNPNHIREFRVLRGMRNFPVICVTAGPAFEVILSNRFQKGEYRGEHPASVVILSRGDDGEAKTSPH